MIAPPIWTSQDFEADIGRASGLFRKERLQEPLEAYLSIFDQYQGVFEDLLESTVDLLKLSEMGLDVLGNARLQEGLRYLASPPMSLDDLKTVAETTSFNKNKLLQEPELVQRTIELVLTALDIRRFPWVVDNREPTEPEKAAAIVASAALLAIQRLGTNRRHEGKRAQERSVEEALSGGFQKVPAREITTLDQAPGEGEFCGEARFGNRKADFVIRLWDRRVMPLECKVSNSATNSVKRLNNDAAVKAVSWRRDFGDRQVVPAAMLSGVYKLRNLVDAQERGLAIFWAHNLDEFTAWIESTRPNRRKK